MSESEQDPRISSFTGATSVPQRGGGPNLDSGSDRYLSAMLRNNTDLVAAGADGCNSSMCARYDVVNISGGGASVSQDIDLAAGADGLLYPAVTVDGNGDGWIVYSEASSSQYAAVVLGKWSGVTWNSGTASGALLIQGVARYCDGSNGTTCSGSGQNGTDRWGDYSALQADPSIGSQVWGTGEYGSTATNQIDWGTVFARAT